ncbi:MAG: M1 family metallopeptidase [Polyangiaceae bacterium]|nr:M1 family metallopeptidase [Polyangiaceae bacterium]
MNAARRLASSLVIVAASALASEASALELPKTSISYRIDAGLDPATRMLRGSEEIRWTNTTDEPVAELPVHLYLNGFSHTRTTWVREVGIQRFQSDDFLRDVDADPWGYNDLLRVRARGPDGERDAAFKPIQPDDGNPWDRSLFSVALPAPVAPGSEIVLTIEFEARLPVPIARTGGRDNFFLISQWFPKIGVIEPKGVRHAPKARNAARQFHGTTEFYADFADFDVTFSAPEGWLLGATGRAEGEPVPDGEGRVKVRHTQRAVHDFALVLGKNLKDQWARHTPKGGGPPVDVRYVVTAGNEHQVAACRTAIEGALDVMGSRIGPYPYDVLTVIMMPFWASRTSGMEYPTLITSVPSDPLMDRFPVKGLLFQESTAIHEFGHQYFYGVIASNEQEESFLDEGFNTYWEGEVMRAVYGADASGGMFFGRAYRNEDSRSFSLAVSADDIREPMRKRPSWLYSPGTYGAQSYPRSAVTFRTAAALYGQDRVDKVFAEYFRRFAFKHPDTEDFLGVAAEAGGPEVGAFFREAFDREEIPDYKVADVKVTKWQPPLGRVITAEGPVVVTRENRATVGEVGLDPEAREEDGRVLMEITDAGWVRGDRLEMGSIKRSLVTPEKPATSKVAGGGYFESVVRIEGPGWDNLPVDVELRFEDRTVIRDRWDGKSRWRKYWFLRGSPLKEVRIDPGGRIAVDVTPQNNSRALEANSSFAADMGLWLGAFSQWLAGGVSLWL